MKKIISILIVVLLLFIGYILWFDNSNVKNHNSNTNNNDDTNEVNKSEWSTNSSLNVSNVYNYDKDEMEAGKLVINNGVLEFIDLKNDVLNSYKYIENVKVIEELYDYCDDKTHYIVLTNDGDIYLSDDNDFMAEEPFYKYELSYKIKDISIPEYKECASLIINVINENDEKIEIEL